MRAFVGLDCELPVLQEYQRTFFSALMMTSPLHVTLKYFGMVSDDDVAFVRSQLRKVHAQRFVLRTDTLTTFHHPEQARLLMLGVRHNKRLLTLQQKIDKVVSRRFLPEKKFVPHITMARSRQALCVDDFASVVSTRVVCNAFYLYIKRDTRYNKAFSFDLK